MTVTHTDGDTCRYCGGREIIDPVTFTVQDGVIIVERHGIYLDSPEAQERLAHVCNGHVYCAGLTPAVKHATTGEWVPGIVMRVGGRTSEDHPFYADLHVPLGMSPRKAAEVEFPGWLVGGMGDNWKLSSSPIEVGDLFSHISADKIVGTGLTSYYEESE